MTDEEIKVAKILRDCQEMLKSGGKGEMTDEEIRVAKILSDCQEMLKIGGNNDEIRRQLTIAKHILFVPLIMQERKNHD
jgi:hypothetical protein